MKPPKVWGRPEIALGFSFAKRYAPHEERTKLFVVLYPALYACAAQLHQPSTGALSYQVKPYCLWKAPTPHPCVLISDESIIDENQQ